jgi:hypothetical protein
MQQGRLPISPPTWEGNPRYAVNMIELPDDKEELRDSLFSPILGRTLVSGRLAIDLHALVTCIRMSERSNGRGGGDVPSRTRMIDG